MNTCGPLVCFHTVRNTHALHTQRRRLLESAGTSSFRLLILMAMMQAILRAVFAVVLLSSATLAVALNATSKQGIDLSGRWNINPRLSDDAEALLAQRQEEERQERRRWEQRERGRTPLEQLDEPVMPPSMTDPRYGRERRLAREAEFRRMLGITRSLEIKQAPDGHTLEIRSDIESRTFQAGSRSQVSMPEGALADSNVGWDGDWFVIERKARKGPRVTEKYRHLKKTDQLESIIAWGGETFLTGIKVHRIFDRAIGTEPPPPDPTRGPYK